MKTNEKDESKKPSLPTMPEDNKTKTSARRVKVSEETVDREVVAERDGGRALTIEAIDAFSVRFKFQGGGALPKDLRGVFSYDRAQLILDKYIKDTTSK